MKDYFNGYHFYKACTAVCFALLLTFAYGFVNTKFGDIKPVIHLIILDPGHGHATFMQSAMNPLIDPIVHVYAPESPDVQNYINSINRMNARSSNPTNWKLVVYKGPDYLSKMISEKKGNAVLISGNNLKKSEYIERSVSAGFHVIADKPMAITDFKTLERSFEIAARNKVLLFDPMDLRYDISSIFQKELSQMPELFGSLEKGSKENPSLVQSNLHHYLKGPAGQTAVRPAWFFDTDQQGHGIMDVSTHLVDLNQWLGFPDDALDYRKDIEVISSREWPSKLSPSEFKAVTTVSEYPEYLKKDLKDSILYAYSNGEINYKVKGVHAKITVVWNYKEPPGTGDTHYSLMRGSKANLEIRQGKEENNKAVLYIIPADSATKEFTHAVQAAERRLQQKYPGTLLERMGDRWVVKPGKISRSNSAEMAIKYIESREMPSWEVPNMLAKYYTTTEALKKSVRE